MLESEPEMPNFLVNPRATTRSGEAAPRSLATLIAPMSTTEFFDRYWERSPFFIPRKEPNFYADLITSKDLDYLCCQSRVKPEEIRMVKTRSDNSVEIREAVLNKNGGIETASLYEQYCGGATLVLNRLQLRWAPIVSLCRDLDCYFPGAVGANAYLTPPNAQGFPVHFDSVDGFILQLEGTKLWKIYDLAMKAPTAETHFSVQAEKLGPTRFEIEFQPGDLLYIPRGFVHQAHTSSCASLHLTVGVGVATMLDLLSNALTKVGSQQDAFRQALPVRLFDDAESQIRARVEFVKLLSQFVEKASFADSMNGLLDRLIDRMQPLTSEGWVQAADIDPMT